MSWPLLGTREKDSIMMDKAWDNSYNVILPL